MGVQCSAVKRHQPVDERQADAESALGPVSDAVGLGEHGEESRHHLGRYPYAVVAHGDDDLIALPAPR